MFKYQLLAAAGFAALACAAPTLANADCKLLQVAEFKLDPKSYQPVVEGSINGHAVKVLIDSGATFSMVTRHEMERLGLPSIQMMGMRAYGIGGDTQVYRAHIQQLKIGDLSKSDLDLYVAGDESATWPTAIILGNDVLSKVDVEFDLPHNAVRMFQPQGCTAPQLVYWGAAYSQAGLLSTDPDHPSIQADAFINGKRILAELDSGAGISVVDATAAAADGVARPDQSDASRAMRGLGPRPEQAWTGRFDSFALGDEKISHVSMQVLPFTGGMAQAETGSQIPYRIHSTASMYLGDDFLHAHRVFVDYQDHLILFSYQGGPVFSTPPAATAAK